MTTGGRVAAGGGPPRGIEVVTWLPGGELPSRAFIRLCCRVRKSALSWFPEHFINRVPAPREPPERPVGGHGLERSSWRLFACQELGSPRP